MRIKAALAGMAMLATAVGSTGAHAYTLPAPDPSYSVELGDFVVYSTPFLNLFFFGDQKGGMGKGFTNYIVDSSPGQLKDFLVVGTAPAAARDNTDVLGGANKGDDAYQTPQPGTSAEWDTKTPPFCGAITASCLTSPDPGGTGQFTGDAGGTWDVQLSALSTFLAGGDLVFFFNQNQTGSNQDIFAWGLVTLIDTDGGNPAKYFEFNNDTSGVFPFVSDGALSPGYTSPATPGEFVFSPGKVCIDSTPPFPVIPCTGTKSDIVINHNLGADDAAYALFAPQLNTILDSPGFGGYDVMQIRFAFGASNNGYEQVFIMAKVETPRIPEPATLVLLGSGLLAVAAMAWRRRRSLPRE